MENKRDYSMELADLFERGRRLGLEKGVGVAGGSENRDRGKQNHNIKTILDEFELLNEAERKEKEAEFVLRLREACQGEGWAKRHD